jgi:hypothetical protein
MPIPKRTELAEVPSMLPSRIAQYNQTGTIYNLRYAEYIDTRSAGIASAGSLSAWLAENGAAPIQKLLIAFGMNARNSQLIPHAEFQRTLSSLNSVIVNWVGGLALPFDVAPSKLVHAVTGETLAAELGLLYQVFARPRSVTNSGGYVAASKTLHCLFPKLTPMIDGKHSGMSYCNIYRASYTPPLGIATWPEWIGRPINGVANPSPQGAGRALWRSQQFLAAIGVNQHIYELWQMANGNPGLRAFLALDPTQGTTGIPRVVDKALW